MLTLTTQDNHPAVSVACKDGSIIVHASHGAQRTLGILAQAANELEEIPPKMADYKRLLRRLGCRQITATRYGAPPADGLARLEKAKS